MWANLISIMLVGLCIVYICAADARAPRAGVDVSSRTRCCYSREVTMRCGSARCCWARTSAKGVLLKLPRAARTHERLGKIDVYTYLLLVCSSVAVSAVAVMGHRRLMGMRATSILVHPPNVKAMR